MNHPIEPRQRAPAIAIIKTFGSAIHSVAAISGCFRASIELILPVKLDIGVLTLWSDGSETPKPRPQT